MEGDQSLQLVKSHPLSFQGYTFSARRNSASANRRRFTSPKVASRAMDQRIVAWRRLRRRWGARRDRGDPRHVVCALGWYKNKTHTYPPATLIQHIYGTTYMPRRNKHAHHFALFPTTSANFSIPPFKSSIFPLNVSASSSNVNAPYSSNLA
jgi:hypothetical protein